jgi:hypothetical protein
MSTRAENWTSYYSNLEGNQGVNLQMAQIMAFNRFQTSQDDYVLNLKNNSGLALLAVNGFHELLLFHNIHFRQQNLFCSESKLLGLMGGGQKAECYRIDPASAVIDLEFNAPAWRDLKGAQDAAAVKALQVPDQNAQVFRGKSSIIVPPLVLTAILESTSLDPTELIPILSTKFQDFDRSSATVKACTILRPVLEFLWGVHMKIIHPLVSSIERSKDSLEWCEGLHLAHIRPPLANAPPPICTSPCSTGPNGSTSSSFYGRRSPYLTRCYRTLSSKGGLRQRSEKRRSRGMGENS